MTNPANKPASNPARIHVKNVMVLPPSSGYRSPASLRRHRRTRPTPLRSTSNGRTRPRQLRGRSGRRPVAVFSHQEGRQHFDRPLVEGPVVDHDVDGGTREPPNALGRRGGADDDGHSPHEPTQYGPLGGGGPRAPAARPAPSRPLRPPPVGRPH